MTTTNDPKPGRIEFVFNIDGTIDANVENVNTFQMFGAAGLLTEQAKMANIQDQMQQSKQEGLSIARAVPGMPLKQ